MAINLADKYAKDVEERFYQASLTQSSFSKDIDMEFTGVRTVKTYEIATAPMNDYTRSGSNRYGTPEELQDNVHEYIMTKDRGFTYTIDKGNNMEQNMAKNAGKSISRQMREVVTPEIDIYRFKVWSENAGQKKVVDAPTKDNILEMVIDAKIAMDDKLVPRKGRTLYVGPAAYKALLVCEEYIRLNDLGSKSLVNGQVGEIMDMVVKQVPTVYLPANVAFMVIMKDSALSPVKLDEYKIHKDPPGISGHLCEGRVIYDAFVRETKKDGIYVATTA